MIDFTKIKYACFGDSITSDEVCGIGTLVAEKLGVKLVGNFAHGNATCSDWYKDGKSISPQQTSFKRDIWNEVNVLSNQVLTLLKHTKKRGETVTWTHPVCGDFSADKSIVGDGFCDDAPDIIYIAIGANDGKTDCDFPIKIDDDSIKVFSEPYDKLTRVGIASALRWAIETLLSSYPNAMIFVASPLPAAAPDVFAPAFSTDVLLKKRKIIKNVCRLCSVNFIDSFAESGFSTAIAAYGADSIGVHPNAEWQNRIAAFIAHRISNEFYMV